MDSPSTTEKAVRALRLLFRMPHPPSRVLSNGGGPELVILATQELLRSEHGGNDSPNVL